MTFATLPLSYCTNVHPGRAVAEVISGLIEHTADVRRRVDFPMAGAVVVDRVADELSGDQALERLAQTLWQHDLCCYTTNTFPFGDFHSERVRSRSICRIGPRRTVFATLNNVQPFWHNCCRPAKEVFPRFRWRGG
ncbi:MAG: hypothetical protein R3C20_03220 [Planctomycetaceae bacterium]